MKVRGCCHQIKQKALKCSGVAVLIPQPDFQISPPLVAAVAFKGSEEPDSQSFNQVQKSGRTTSSPGQMRLCVSLTTPLSR